MSSRVARCGVWLAVAVAVAVGGCAMWEPSVQPDGRVYRIGTDNTIPYHYLTERGEVSGLVGEVLQEAARRSGVKLEWRLRSEGPGRALAARAVDLWPLLSVQHSVWPDFHFTAPYLRNAYIAISLDEEILSSMKRGPARKVGALDAPLARRLAAGTFPGALVVGFPTREAAMSALCAGQLDAVSIEARTAQHLALDRPPGCEGARLYSIGLNVAPSELAIASTKGSEWAADRLRDEIDAMQADGTMARILQKWNHYYSGEAETIYREMRARSAEMLSHWLASGLGCLILALLFLLRRFRRAQRAAMLANASKSSFLANMSHEIRTPLNGILGMGQLLGGTALEGEQREYLDMMMGSGRMLLGMVNDVLDLAQVERGKLKLQLEPVDLKSLIASTIRVFEFQARAKGLELRCEGIEALPGRVLADGARLRQILTNLVGNALKFTLEGEVVVAVAYGSGQLGVEVRDTGIGVAAESQELLFKKFSQADATISKRFGGSGLGLAIARELVVFMGGAIGMRGREGAGSIFWFTLPAAEASTAGPRRPDGSEATAPVKEASVLLVEDNLVNQRIASRMLEKAGHRVTTAADGGSALEAWEAGRFDVVLMDCQMPGMDGFETTAEIRKREQGQRRTPIIALTASAMKGERERCLAAGMDDFLSKPIDLVELHRALASWVAAGRGTVPGAECYTIAGEVPEHDP